MQDDKSISSAALKCMICVCVLKYMDHYIYLFFKYCILNSDLKPSYRICGLNFHQSFGKCIFTPDIRKQLL